MRMTLKGDAIAEGLVKIEPLEQGEVIMVPCTKLRFTQRTCGSFFRDGRRVLDTIQEIVSGGLCPEEHRSFELRVIRRNGLLLSLDNRRLFCLKEAQRQLRPRVLRARGAVYTWDLAFDVLL